MYFEFDLYVRMYRARLLFYETQFCTKAFKFTGATNRAKKYGCRDKKMMYVRAV